MKNEGTQIPIKKDTRERLRVVGIKGETYDKIINDLIDFEKKFDNEKEFSNWFEHNYTLFGFDKIKKKNKFPDFTMIKNGKEVKVELETIASNFILHRHDPKKVDLVICLHKNKELPVKVIEINNFIFGHKVTTIQLKKATWKKLMMLKIKLDLETLEKVIAYLLKRS